MNETDEDMRPVDPDEAHSAGAQPTDAQRKINQVSVRAVLIPDGHAAAAALTENGILDPIQVPFVYADESFSSAAVLGDGRTPNLVATLELDDNDPPDPAAESFGPDRQSPPDAGQASSAPRITSAPPAYGLRSLAPVRQRPV